ncbi:hypothetical protein ACPWT1_07950 [Ramlibacter sp. MMS24-I3-19]|uniref:hypothetical protein n=1 Tax=Ramlibacter sp. MMS24-I3-19 TaxID=3416606 RepID=UPI003D031CC2
MSTKSDRDNRSNQLNPRHGAYWSSRGGDHDEAEDEAESEWIVRDRARAASECPSVAIHLAADFVGNNGEWVRLEGMEPVGESPVQAAGDWFWVCLKGLEKIWAAETTYAQLYVNGARSTMFLRRPDLAGHPMSDRANEGMAKLREAELGGVPRCRAVLTVRGSPRLVRIRGADASLRIY